MLETLLAAIALQTAPSGAPASLLAVLCNDTPARVAISVARTTSPRLRMQRGWLTVEPGDCLRGQIGDSLAQGGLIHARSGAYRWPPGSGAERLCVPARSHDAPTAFPPCREGSEAAEFESVDIEPGRVRHVLRYTVRCEDLSSPDVALCALGRTGPDGFAETVRTLEVCNQMNAPIRLALAAEARSGDGFRVEGWRQVEGGACEDVWRGLSAAGRAYVRSETLDGRTIWDEEPALFCLDPERDFTRTTAAPDETECRADGLSLQRFRTVRFGARTDRVTLEMRAPF